MLISEINRFLAERGRATMADLTDRFGIAPAALRGMLDLLVAKGRITRIEAGGDCGSCCRCAPTTLEVYEWRGRG